MIGLFAEITKTTDTEAESQTTAQKQRKLASWSYDVKGPAETCVIDIVNRHTIP